jgi:alpha-tubulin suppressor-like RCC1 family protein
MRKVVIIALIAGCGCAAMAAHAAKVIDVAQRSNFTMQLRDDGTVWAWGDNTYAELGDGSTNDRAVPARVQGLPTIVAVAAGTTWALALDNTGHVWAWGDNSLGQVGDGSSYGYRTRPVQIPGLSGVVQISAGGTHSLARASDGSVWAWGGNLSGQIGDGTVTTFRRTPVRATGISGVTAIEAGGYHSLAVTSDGRLWAWGSHQFGQLGLGGDEPLSFNVPTVVPGMSSMVGVGSGQYSSFAIRKDGTLFAWGRNDRGELGDGSTTDQYSPEVVGGIGNVAVITSGTYTIALLNDGSLYAWGVDLLTNIGSLVPSQQSTPNSQPVYAIASGANVTIADQSGRVFAVGPNDKGQLAIGDLIETPAPTAVKNVVAATQLAAADDGSAVLRLDGSVYAWGNISKQTSTASQSTFGNPRPIVGFTSDVKSIKGASTYFLALQIDGTMMGWGLSPPGLACCSGPVEQPQMVPGIGNATNIAVSGSGTAIAVLKSGQAMFCSQQDCALDLGFSDAVQTAGGSDHMLILSRNGQVYCLGVGQKSNFFGQCGDGTTNNPPAGKPVRVQGLPGPAKSIAAGDYFSVAIMQDGSVYVWGLTPDRGVEGHRREETTPGWLLPTRVSELNGMSQIVASEHLLALDARNRGYAWGLGTKAGLRERVTPGRVPSMDGLVSLSAGPFHSVGIATDGHVVAWGKNFNEQLSVDRPLYATKWTPVIDPLNQAYTSGAVPVVEFMNSSIGSGHYFITAFAAEALALDSQTPVAGWQRTGRAWRAWLDQASAGPGAKPVYRFFSSRWNGHFYTIEPSERDALLAKNPTQDPAIDWALEAVAFYALASTVACPSVNVLPRSPYICAGGAPPAAVDCPAGYYPVYRAYDIGPTSPRLDPNHRFTPNWIDVYRDVRFFGYVYEGVAFCSPASTQPGGDLHANHNFPGDTIDAGAQLSIDYWFNNAGPGDGSGATIVAALPTSVGWTVTCTAYNRAQCPPDLVPADLRNGVIVSTFPAGGLLQLRAMGTAPMDAQTLEFGSSIGPASGAPDPFMQNNAGATSRTVVKAPAQCVIALSPSALSVVAGGGDADIDVDAPAGCAWTIASDQPWATLSAGSGTGPGSVHVTANGNATASDRLATVAATASSGQRVEFPVRELGAPPAPPSPCVSVKLTKQADQVGPNRVVNFVQVQASTPDCYWDAFTLVEWLALTGATRAGEGQVEYEVKENTGLYERRGDIRVGTTTFTVIQAAPAQVAPPDTGGGTGGETGGGGGGDSGGDGGGSGGSGAGG